MEIELEQEFIEKYIAIGVDSFEDAESIFKLTSSYLLEIKGENFDSGKSTFVEGLLHKMISIAEHFELDETLITEIENVSKNFVNVFSQNNSAAKIPHFNKAFSVSMKFYNAMVKLKPKANLDFGPFKPSVCDKEAITLKISQAISLINASPLLSEKAKKRLVENLSNVIAELHKRNPNWSNYYKNVGYSIMLLGSLGSIASGALGVNELLESKKILEEANSEVQHSSTSITRKDIKEAFVINENILIDAKESLKILETKVGQKDKK